MGRPSAIRTGARPHLQKMTELADRGFFIYSEQAPAKDRKTEAKMQEPGERKRHIHMVALEAPAQKSNSLRQRPQNVALQAAQVLRASISSTRIKCSFACSMSPNSMQAKARSYTICGSMVSISHGSVQAVESLQAISLLAEDGAKKRNGSIDR